MSGGVYTVDENLYRKKRRRCSCRRVICSVVSLLLIILAVLAGLLLAAFIRALTIEVNDYYYKLYWLCCYIFIYLNILSLYKQNYSPVINISIFIPLFDVLKCYYYLIYEYLLLRFCYIDISLLH